MALVLKDRVLESSTSTGTGTFTLTGAQTGYQSFTAIGNGNTTYYTIQGKNTDGTLTGEWEVGVGTWSTGNTLSRDTVLESSNSNNLVVFSVGDKDVFCDLPAEKVSPTDVLGTMAYQNANAVNITGGIVDVDAGTAALPTLGTTGDPNTGIFFPAADTIAFTIGGNESARFNSSGNFGVGTTNASFLTQIQASASAGVGGQLNLRNSAARAIGNSSRLSFSPNLDYSSTFIGGYIEGLDTTGSATNDCALVFGSGSGGAPTEKMRLTASGNLGLGTTPSAWTSSWKALQTPGLSLSSPNTSSFYLGQNWFQGSGGNTYINSAPASLYAQINGAHSWSIAPSGTAGNPITFTQAMTLHASGGLSLGNTTDPSANNLSVTGFTSSASFRPTSSTVPTNGVYLPAVNAVGLATNSTRAVYIDNNQNFSIGTINPTQRFSITGTAGGAPTYGSIGDNQERLIWGYAHTSGVTSNIGSAQVLADSSGNLLLSTRTNSTSSIVFYTNSATTAVQQAKIFASGGMSIGNNTDPGAANLSVSGIVTANNVRSNSATIASASTITPTSDTTNQYTVTALAVPATIAIPSGTPIDGQKLSIRIKDDGTGRALTWTTSAGGYRVIGTTLPTTTTASKVTYVGCVYNSQDSFWDVLAVATQA